MSQYYLQHGKSQIHGIGIFAAIRLTSGRRIPMLHSFFLDGGFNHSCRPNARLELNAGDADNNVVILRAIKRGEEVTVAYTFELPNCNCEVCRCVR